ncbi:MAG: LytTR family transcriptional regulator [Bacteroidetes bacterium]|nr:LytTR family transcriptional regulator [Bacteroidota bacterium]
MEMINQIYKWLNRKYLQNYIIKNPYIGTLIIAIFCFGFLTIYKPLSTHEARTFSYEVTMAIYCFISAIPVIVSVKVLKSIKYFSKREDWTILKELISITLILIGMGVAIYFIAFFIEIPGQRWNISTFLDSCKYAFLIGIIPFTFFAAINYRYLLITGFQLNEENNAIGNSVIKPSEVIIQISSKLKKEELSFYPSQFMYALSDGNYVDFYLKQNNQIKKETIRNSISSIEQQLSEIPYFFRTHRAFIVNLKMVSKKQGNTLGYRLKLVGTDFEIPVSRQKTRIFDKRFKQFH